jgi:Asp/Glu/hydantoin racemase
MSGRILVINPNSNEHVTEDISAAVAGLRRDDGPAIDCVTLADGPPGIETQVHVDTVIAPLLALAQRESNRTSAVVVACFADPGLASLRESLALPVFGIAESGFSIALTKGDRFGIISIRSGAIPRHRRHIASLGLSARLAGDRAIDMGVGELRGGDRVMARLVEVGARLKREDGADVLVLGCAGLGRYRKPLGDRLGLPVVDPVQAAVGLAELTLRLEAQ